MLESAPEPEDPSRPGGEAASPRDGLASVRVALLPAILFVVLVLAELASILKLNDGRFTYTLDDPYIHLALVENLARGHYGINLEEASSPSSSILWPFLLLPFRAAAWAPFALDVVFSLAAVFVLARLAALAIPETLGARVAALRTGLVVLCVPAMNLVGLTFQGMEHPLQLLVTLLLVLGFAEEARSGRVPRWLPVALVVGPLVRYEVLAFSVPGIVLLAVRRHRAAAAASALALGAVLAAFSYALVARGLDPVPTSVLVKSQPVSSHSVSSVLLSASTNLGSRAGGMLALVGIALAAAALDGRRSGAGRGLAVWALFAVGAHLAVGQFGSNHRYEAYVWGGALAAALVLHGETLAAFARRRSAGVALAATAAVLFTATFPYWNTLRLIPNASNNVFEQHLQMHRFATEFWRRPIAVNDIGYVSYRNDSYVLDLWGLASSEAARSRRASKSADWMRELARRHDVQFAMIYTTWFKRLPDDWFPIAELRLSRRVVTVSRSKVTFFAIGEEARQAAPPLLEEFRRTLPPRIQLTEHDGTIEAWDDAERRGVE